MAGQELVTEGFQPGQVGSSAMPHKMNTRSCERINGFEVILRGHLAMVAGLAGDQWNEGDVSCSVVRRVALPDAFFATDGLFETLLTVLAEFGAYPAVIDRELDRYLPFLATTKVLMAAVRAGVGREVGPRGHQGARGRGRAGPCARRAPRATTWSSASPPTHASVSTPRALGEPAGRPARLRGHRAGTRWRASSPRSRRWWPRTRTRPGTGPRRSSRPPLEGGRRRRRRRTRIWPARSGIRGAR